MISSLKYYSQLLKLRLSLTVVISATAGYLIGVQDFILQELVLLIFGGFFVTGSANGFNQVLEKEYVKTFVNKHEAEGLKKVTGLSDLDMNLVDSGDHLKIGDNDIEFIHTPGHTPGSQCFKVNNSLISGDTLFVQGCGRVDLPGANSEDMFYSLRKLSKLPDETIIYPGHNYGPKESETLEKVKEINSYLRIEELELWNQIM